MAKARKAALGSNIEASLSLGAAAAHVAVAEAESNKPVLPAKVSLTAARRPAMSAVASAAVVATHMLFWA